VTQVWRPGRPLKAVAIKLQRRVSSAIASARAQVPHRGEGGGLGGSLVTATRSRSLLIEGKAFAGVAWSKLGQKFLWFIRGTNVKGKRHQGARKIDLTVKPSEINDVVEGDALRHFSRREKRERPRI